MILNKHSVKEVFFYLFLLLFNVVGLVGLFHKQCVHTPSGVEVCTRVGGEGGGGAPKISNIYIIILMFSKLSLQK